MKAYFFTIIFLFSTPIFCENIQEVDVSIMQADLAKKESVQINNKQYSLEYYWDHSIYLEDQNGKTKNVKFKDVPKFKGKSINNLPEIKTDSITGQVWLMYWATGESFKLMTDGPKEKPFYLIKK